jgi:predicted nucleic acid-binding protein
VTDIICNATPLIAFARIGKLSLMQNVVEHLVIPNAVAVVIVANAAIAFGQGTEVFLKPRSQVNLYWGWVIRHRCHPTFAKGEWFDR